ncbi:hypothetical protein [Salibacter sp.]|uniref:hypothetical protein n=1 Tax=Salibacter sp. TaxID=2010995 RepID=UPI0028700B87|nr:hypothetical protein [Salibacter sp.]MDR9399325.1 hypothetical protein [Salibacter sp.]MDR9487770.1 hypothetical protein [Salibacter sp.]
MRYLLIYLLIFFFYKSSLSQNNNSYLYVGLCSEPRVFINDQGPFQYSPLPLPTPVFGFGKNFKINNFTSFELSGALKSFSFSQKISYEIENKKFGTTQGAGLFFFSGYYLNLSLRKKLWSNTFLLFGIGVDEISSARYSYTHELTGVNYPVVTSFEVSDINSANLSLNAAASKVWWVNEQNTRPIELRLHAFMRFRDHFKGQTISQYKSQKYTDDISTGRLGVMLTFHVYLNKQFQE